MSQQATATATRKRTIVPHGRDETRLVAGRGRYMADLGLPGALQMAVVRSPFAHAAIAEIDISYALDMPGVRAVFSGRDLAAHLQPFPGIIKEAPPYYPLAIETARYAGEPVAIVLAEDRYSAEDGAGAVLVDYEELEAVIAPVAAASPAAPLLHPERGSNIVWSRRFVYGDPDAAFLRGSTHVAVDTVFPKYNSTPLETAGIIADWSPATAELTVHSNFQGPFSLLPVLCRALGLESHQVRLIAAEDVGGSFGNKAMLYPYIALAALGSKLAGAPVRWIEDRQEHLYGSASGTNRVTHAEAAVDDEGVVHGVRYRILEDVGAYLRAPEPSCVMRSITMFAGPYDIPHGEIDVEVVVTNKLPTGLNRGYGGQQHIFTLERLMDAVAATLDLDPAEVRRRNLIPRTRFPFTTGSGTRYDSGDYQSALDLVLEKSGYRELRNRSRDLGDRWIGAGLAVAVHSSAANMGYVTLALEPDVRAYAGYRPKSGTREWAQISVDPSGKVFVEIATAGCGQGHRTTVVRLAAGLLEIDAADVTAIDELDTRRSGWSVSTGSYSSRFAVMVGSAVWLATEALRSQLLDVAATILAVDRAELVWAGGRAVATTTGGSLSLKEIAGAVHWDSGSFAPETVPPLRAAATFSPDAAAPPDADDRVNAASAYGFMADIAVVEIDKATFIPRLVRYYAVHDLGRTLEPAIAAGQVAGGVVHGMGGALYEELSYTADGQLETGSFVDYLCPTAAEAPEIHVDHVDVPSPFNPLGVKGGGESSSMSAPAAIAAAVEDALGHAGISVERLPVLPADLWARVTAAAGGE